jgi:hypothetical protein
MFKNIYDIDVIREEGGFLLKIIKITSLRGTKQSLLRQINHVCSLCIV